MRLLLDSLILAMIGTTVLSADEGSSNTSNLMETTSSTSATSTTTSTILSNKNIVISWRHTSEWNPLSTEDLYYEIWHNGKILTALDDNYIKLPLRSYPELESGCIQIRAILGEEQSDLSDETCYEITAGTGLSLIHI